MVVDIRFQNRINEEGNQANHQRQHQGILCPVKIAATNVHFINDRNIYDYHKKVSIKYVCLRSTEDF
jgi:hypothetical protein